MERGRHRLPRSSSFRGRLSSHRHACRRIRTRPFRQDGTRSSLKGGPSIPKSCPEPQWSRFREKLPRWDGTHRNSRAEVVDPELTAAIRQDGISRPHVGVETDGSNTTSMAIRNAQASGRRLRIYTDRSAQGPHQVRMKADHSSPSAIRIAPSFFFPFISISIP